MRIKDEIAYRILRRFSPPASWLTRLTPSSAPTSSKLAAYFGDRIWPELTGRTVIDFGCGKGADALEIARRGARRVIGVDVRTEALAVAARAAEQAGLADRCTFVTAVNEPADCVLCIDAFEHFADPASILRLWATMLRPGGKAFVSFGPTWLHPLGGHGFSVFPWAHLLFTEDALLRWRSDYCDDGARRFHEVAGGLNGITIRRFEALVRQSPFRLASFEAVPIRAARWLHNRLTREFLTSMVRCELVMERTGSHQPEAQAREAVESLACARGQCFVTRGLMGGTGF